MEKREVVIVEVIRRAFGKMGDTLRVRIVFGLLRRRPGSRHNSGEYEALEN